MSSTSKITSRVKRPVVFGAAGSSVTGANVSSSRRWSVTLSANGRSPFLLIAVAEEDCERVHQEQHDHHHEDRGRCQVDELAVGVLGPREDLDRKRREG